MDAETSEKFIFGALIGGALGATVALMLTPISGERLRRKIARGLHYEEDRSRSKKHAGRHNRNNKAGGRSSPLHKRKEDSHAKFEKKLGSRNSSRPNKGSAHKESASAHKEAHSGA